MVIGALTYVMFIQAPRIVRFLGSTNLTVVTRLMGLIVATIGVGMVMTGLTDTMREFIVTLPSH